ncbi:MAG: DUF932 domain-containing protein [Candidatus Shapirobacteria bacterium]
MDAFFNVIREPVFRKNGKEILNKFVLVNEDTNNELGIVSKDYKIIYNKQVYDLFSEAMNKYSIVSETHHLDSIGRRWKCDWVFDDDRLNAEILPGDSVGLAMRFFNAYDGKHSFGFELFGFRARCSNGQVFGKRSLFSKTYQHFTNSPQRLHNDFILNMDNFQINVDIWQEWTKIPFTKSQFSVFLEDKKYLGDRLKAKLVNNTERVLNMFNMDETMFGIFNVITYYSSWETKSNKGSYVFSNGYNMLTRLAEEFYEIKTPNQGIKLLK